MRIKHCTALAFDPVVALTSRHYHPSGFVPMTDQPVYAAIFIPIVDDLGKHAVDIALSEHLIRIWTSKEADDTIVTAQSREIG